MSADRKTAFDANTAKRVLEEFRATSPEVEELFKVHVGQKPAEEVGIDDIASALGNLNGTLCLVVHRKKGTEYLLSRPGDDGREWYSITEYPHRTHGPHAIYSHNVSDRLSEFAIKTVKVSRSPFAAVELPEYDLDEDEVTLDV